MLRIPRSLALTAGLILTLAGCSSGSAEYGQDVAASAANQRVEASSPEARGVVASAPTPAVRRDIIRKAGLTLRVDNLEDKERRVAAISREVGGYVESVTSSDLDSAQPTMSLTLRVPADRFDGALGALEQLGTRLAKSIESQDVTAQLVDLEARLRTMAAEEETYRRLLKQTNKVKDILEVQQRLGDIRAEIESMAAQRKALAAMAAYSTITLSLERQAIPHGAPKDPNWFAQTWGESTTALGSAFRAVAAVLVWLVVFSPVWVPILLLVRRALRPVLPPRRA